ncbi:MAG: helix-turn-helix transcriptional regulator [Slackia sp.]|nr:helix-turn-helix transcriptional regulator [Slackia sp.]
MPDDRYCQEGNVGKQGNAARFLRLIDERMCEASKNGLLLGMACNFAFVVQAFFAPAMTHVTPFSLSFTDMSYLSGAFFAAILLARARKKTALPSASALWGISFAVALLFAVYGVLAPDVSGIASMDAGITALFLFGGLLFGAYLAYVIPLWLRVCTAFDPEEVVWTILLAGSVGAVLVWFLADMGSVRLTVASIVMLLLGTYMLARTLRAQSDGDELFRSSRSMRRDEAPRRLFAACFLVAFAFVSAISFAEGNGASALYRTGTFFAPVLLACVCLLVLKGFTVSSLLNVAVPIMTAVVMTASFFGIEPVLSFDLAVAGVFLFLVYAVVAILFATYGDESAAYRSFLALAFSFAGGCVLGRIGSALAVVKAPFSSDVVVLVSILAVVVALVLCVGMGALVNRGGCKDGMDASLGPSSMLVLERRIDRAAEKGNLGRREKEVLFLLLEGKTAGEIAKAMVVAPGTAKSHVYHVYKKLGVHSRAELFEMFGVEEERNNPES